MAFNTAATHVEPKLGPLPDDLTPATTSTDDSNNRISIRSTRSGIFSDIRRTLISRTNTPANFTNRVHREESSRGADRWLPPKRERSRRCSPFLASSDALKSVIKPGEWNQVEIIAEGNMLTHIINGHIMAILLDTDPEFSRAKGVIALEIEGPGNLKIRHRNIWLKTLP